MKKIQFDVAFGVYEVESFDADTKIIDELDVFNALDGSHWQGEGTLGAEVNVETFNKIKDEYGIRNL